MIYSKNIISSHIEVLMLLLPSVKSYEWSPLGLRWRCLHHHVPLMPICWFYMDCFILWMGMVYSCWGIRYRMPTSFHIQRWVKWMGVKSNIDLVVSLNTHIRLSLLKGDGSRLFLNYLLMAINSWSSIYDFKLVRIFWDRVDNTWVPHTLRYLLLFVFIILLQYILLWVLFLV